MKRFLRVVPVLVAIAVIGMGMVGYNHYDVVGQRKVVHAELQDRIMNSAVAKEYKAIDTAALESMAASGELERLVGEEIVVSGYGYPLNDDYIYDMSSLMKFDPCCPEPLLYKNVTELDVSPLPFDSYLLQTTPDPVTVTVMLAGEPIEFPSNSPRLYKGTLQVGESGGRPFQLADAEPVDLSAGMIQRATPPPAAESNT